MPVWGLIRNQHQLPPWAFPPLRFLAHSGGRKRNRNRPSPHTLFADKSHATNRPASQGIYHHERNLLFREDVTPLGFCTSSALSTLWAPRSVGLWFPLMGSIHVTTDPSPIFTLSDSRPKLIETTVTVTARRDSRT
jgi:hypothetical protein